MEQIVLPVGGPDKEGVYTDKPICFPGKLIDSYESFHIRTELYARLEGGYLVYVVEDKFGKDPVSTLHPSSDPSWGYTDEEISRRWPIFDDAVEIPQERDTDSR